MKVFITGGTGFIGRWVVPVLVEHGHTVMVLIQEHENNPFLGIKKISIARGDLNEINRIESIMRDFEPDSLVHLAWEGLPDYSAKMCFHNFELSLNLFKAAAGIVKHNILSTGSCWEYASRNGEQSEDSPLGSLAVFPAVKNALRFMGEAIALERKISFHWLRLFFVYGPGQKKQSLIPSIINSVKRKEIPKIKTPENGNDFIYVEDVARAVADILKRRPKRTVYNVGTGISVTVEDVVKATFSAVGNFPNGNFFAVKQEQIVQNFWGNISRIREDVGWEPKVRIMDGIKNTLRGS